MDLRTFGHRVCLGIVIFAFCKISKPWSGKLWRKTRFLKGRDGEKFPLVTINSSGDGNAGKETHLSAPMATPVYSSVVDRKDTIKKLNLLVYC